MIFDITTVRSSVAVLMHIAFERYGTERLQMLAELCLTLCEVSDLNTLVRSYRLICKKTQDELVGKDFEYPLLEQLTHILKYYEKLTD